MSSSEPHIKEIARLDPETDYRRIYRLTAFYDFPTDIRMGFNLAFYRTFSTPHIAELLVKTGEMQRHHVKRGYDTGIVIYELIANGFDHPRGREMVRLLNRVHYGIGITNEDYLYVLSAFIVVPIRWIDQTGWRPLLDVEREASNTFYRELGRRMNIDDLPQTYAQAEKVLDDYEDRHLAPSPAGATLMAATQDLLATRLPRPLRPLTTRMTSALINDTRLSNALSLPAPNSVLVALIKLATALQNQRKRRREPRKEPWFTPGQPSGTIYANGYTLDQIGPES